MNQSQIKQLLTLSNSSISVFTQTLQKFDKVNMLRHSERCAGHGGYYMNRQRLYCCEGLQEVIEHDQIKCSEFIGVHRL